MSNYYVLLGSSIDKCICKYGECKIKITNGPLCYRGRRRTDMVTPTFTIGPSASIERVYVPYFTFTKIYFVSFSGNKNALRIYPICTNRNKRDSSSDFELSPQVIRRRNFNIASNKYLIEAVHVYIGGSAFIIRRSRSVWSMLIGCCRPLVCRWPSIKQGPY